MYTLSYLAARERARDLADSARRAASAPARHAEEDQGATPVSWVTLRQAVAADRPRLRGLARRSGEALSSGPTVVAEVDGRLRAALPLDGGAPLCEPVHRGAELLDLLRLRAGQLSLDRAGTTGGSLAC